MIMSSCFISPLSLTLSLQMTPFQLGRVSLMLVGAWQVMAIRGPTQMMMNKF